MAEDGHLFEPPPATPPPDSQQRVGDRKLYTPPRQRNAKYSVDECARVRALLQAHLALVVDQAVDGGAQPVAAWGTARGDFARDWVALATKLNITVPGRPRRTQHVRTDPRVDAARTTLRHFLEGTDQPAWVLVGIESVVCDRRGLALPGAAYEYQGQLA